MARGDRGFERMKAQVKKVNEAKGKDDEEMRARSEGKGGKLTRAEIKALKSRELE